MYLEGKGMSQDYAAAFKLFQKAADQGAVKSQATLGEMYLEGQGVPKDVKKGCGILRDAAAKGEDVQWEIDRYCPK